MKTLHRVYMNTFHRGLWLKTFLLSALVFVLIAMPKISSADILWTSVGGVGSDVGVTFKKVVHADVNDDGRMDLVGSSSDGIYVWLQELQWICPVEKWTWGLSSSAVTVTTGLQFDSLDVGDLDNDGDLDIVAGDSTGNGFRIFIGDGTGLSWVPGALVDDTRSYHSIKIVDVNNDGKADIFGAEMNSWQGRTWLGDGVGGFAQETTNKPVTGNTPKSLAFYDLNKDGRLDFLATNYQVGMDNGDIVYYSRRSANDGWTEETGPITGRGNWHSLVVADLNRDGYGDVVAATGQSDGDNTSGEKAGVYVWYGTSSGGWREASSHPATIEHTYLSVKVTDLDNDGYLDIVAARIGGGILVWLGSMEEVWTASTSPDSNGVYDDITLFDYDNDGNLDIAGVSGGSILIRRQNGGVDEIGWKDFLYPTGSGGFQGIASGDLNNDGNPDVVAASNSQGVRVWYGDGDHSWRKAFAVYSGYNGAGNGTLDVANIETNDSLTLTESWTAKVITANGNTPTFEITHGGVTESAPYTLPGTYTEPDTGVSFVIYDGSDDFQVNDTFTFRTTATGITDSGKYYGVAVEDFNNDSNLDVAAASNGGGGIDIWYGNGAGEWSAPENIGIGSYYYIATGDIDHDGDKDIVAGSDGQVSVWQNDNATGFLTALENKIGDSTAYSGVALGDIDNDGNLDVAASSQDGHRVHVWTGDGTGSFASLYGVDNRSHTGPRDPLVGLLGMTYEYDGVALDDFNRDGNLDIVAGNSGDHGLHVWFGDGGGRVGTPERDGVINWRLSYATPAATGCQHPGVGYLSSQPHASVIEKYRGDWGLDAILFTGAPTVRVGADTVDYGTTTADWTLTSQARTAQAPWDFNVETTDGGAENTGAYAYTFAPTASSTVPVFTGLGNGTFDFISTTPGLTVSETWTITVTANGGTNNPIFTVVHGGSAEFHNYSIIPGLDYYEPDTGVTFRISDGAIDYELNDQWTFDTIAGGAYSSPPNYTGDATLPNVSFRFNAYTTGFGGYSGWNAGVFDRASPPHKENVYFSTYSPGVTTYGTYYGVDTGDFNNDGYPDIVAANKGNGGVQLWINGGESVWLRSKSDSNPISEVWTEAPSPITFGNYIGVVVLDFNKDGLPDIASAHDITSGVGTEVWLNTQDPFPPTVDVTSLVPAVGEIDVVPSISINVTFSEDIDPLTLRNEDAEGGTSPHAGSTISVYGSKSKYHRGAIFYDNLTFTVTFIPDLQFSSEEIVTVSLGGYIRDIAGNRLDGNEDGISGDGYIWSFTIKDTMEPKPPTSLTGIAGESLVSLSWVPPTKNEDGSDLLDLAGYNVYKNISSPVSEYPPAPENSSLIPVGTETFTVTGLTNVDTYNFIVRAVDFAGNESINSNEISLSPQLDTIPPAPPTGLTSIDGDSRVDLSWIAPTLNNNSSTMIDLAGYWIYRSENETSFKSNYTNGNTVFVNSTSGLSIGDVLILGPNGSAQSEIVTITNIGVADDITVSPATPNLKYDYLASDPIYGPVAIINAPLLPVGTENYTDLTVTNGLTYYYAVIAEDSVTNKNQSDPSNVIVSNPDTDNVAPAAPAIISASGADNAILLNWSSNFLNEDASPTLDFQSYNIYRNNVTFASYSTYNILSSGATLVKTINDINTLTWEDTVANGLQYGVTYYYRITGQDIYGNESEVPSNELSAAPVNPVAVIMLSASDYVIPADGIATSTITAFVNNVNSNPVVDGTVIDFSVACSSIDCGTLSDTTATTTNGQAIITITSGAVRTNTVTVTGTSGLTTGNLTMSYKPGPPSSGILSASPIAIAADGVSSASLSVVISDSAGDPVKDGLQVQFTTDLGTFPNTFQTSDIVLTANGLATIDLTSGLVSGSPNINAQVGSLNISGSPVQFTNKPAFINMSAVPTTIAADGVSTSTVTAIVRDSVNAPIPDGLIIDFSTTGGTLGSYTSSISGGNGRATVTLTSDASNGTGTVTASWIDQTTLPFDVISGTVTVNFLSGDPASLLLSSDKVNIAADGVQFGILSAEVRDSNGFLVNDGNFVNFSSDVAFVNISAIDQGSGDGATVNGIAKAAVWSSTKGTALITAYPVIGSGSGNINVNFIEPPSQLVVYTDVPKIPADGVSSATITAYVQDKYGNPIQDLTFVNFSTSAGTILSTPVATSGGIATTSIVSETTVTTNVTITATSEGVSGNSAIDFSPGAPAIITLSSDPLAIAGNGTSKALLTAVITDSLGNPVKDGLNVTFKAYSSDNSVPTDSYGTFPNGTETSQLIQTVGGEASIDFTSGTAVTGKPQIHVIVGDQDYAAQPLEITAMPAFINVTGVPSTIAADGVTTSTITATVTDGVSFLPDGLVINFATTGGTLDTPTGVISGGTGEATVTLTSEASNGTGDVSASWSDGFTTITSNIFTVTFLSSDPDSLVLTADETIVSSGGTTIIRAVVRDVENNLVNDGQVVNFSWDGGFANLSTVDLGSGKGATVGGEAIAVLSSSNVGTTTVSAIPAVGSGSGSVDVTFVEPASQITIYSNSVAIPADGFSQATINAYLQDQYGNPVTDGIFVNFSTSDGTFAATGNRQGGATTVGGIASIDLQATTVATLGVTVSAWSDGVGPVTLNMDFNPGPPAVGFTNMSSSPAGIVANGFSTASITAYVRDLDGDFVKDGMYATFFTDLGTFPNGAQVSDLISTVNGKASVDLTSGSTAGTPNIRIVIGSVDKTQTPLEITPVPAFINITADPNTIPANGVDSTTITARVTDILTNSIPDGLVIEFATTGGILSSTTGVISGGAGEATITLTSETSNGLGDISASWSDGFTTITSNIFTVAFLSGYPASVELTADQSIVSSGSSTILRAVLRDGAGNYVNDGSAVFFTWDAGFANLSAVDIGSGTGATVGGEAIAVLSSSGLGTTTVTAAPVLGTGDNSVDVTFVTPASQLTVIPTSYAIPADGSSTTVISGYLQDTNSNPAADG
ncbi:MAG: FG-GAP-like repeat-containing protein, partial [Deltaproteobacteria bacterium]|nr:FG-GAP-like repeat-containing protein [Deltaproteobacteria bacterium]